MKRREKINNDISTIDWPSYQIKLPKKAIGPDRKSIRRLLRRMLPMDQDQRQFQEEQKLYAKRSRAQ